MSRLAFSHSTRCEVLDVIHISYVLSSLYCKLQLTFFSLREFGLSSLIFLAVVLLSEELLIQFSLVHLSLTHVFTVH